LWFTTFAVIPIPVQTLILFFLLQDVTCSYRMLPVWQVSVLFVSIRSSTSYRIPISRFPGAPAVAEAVVLTGCYLFDSLWSSSGTRVRILRTPLTR